MGPKAAPPPVEDPESDVEVEPEEEPCFCKNRMYAEGEQCRIGDSITGLQYADLPELFSEYSEFIEVENAIKREKRIKKELHTLPQWVNNTPSAKNIKMINKRLDHELYSALFASLKVHDRSHESFEPRHQVFCGAAEKHLRRDNLPREQRSRRRRRPVFRPKHQQKAPARPSAHLLKWHDTPRWKQHAQGVLWV